MASTCCTMRRLLRGVEVRRGVAQIARGGACRRSAGISGSDCISRCTSRPRVERLLPVGGGARRSARPRSISSSNADDGASGIGSGACAGPEARAASAGNSADRVLRSRVARMRRCLRLARLATCDSAKLFRRCRPLRPARCRSGSHTRSYQQPSGRLRLAVGAANDQPVGGARHRHIKQAPVFVLGLAQSASCARAGDRRHVVALAPGPDQRAVGKRRAVAAASARSAAMMVSARMTIGASSPLAPCTVMTRTSSRAISMSRLISIRASRSQATKALQRWRLAPLVVEREVEEFVERVVGLRAKPRHRTAAVRHRRRESWRRTQTASRAAPPCASASRRVVAAANFSPDFCASAVAQRQRAAVQGDVIKVLVGEAKQRAAQRGRQREIVLRQQQRVGERHQVHHRDVLGEHQPVGARNREPRHSSARG